MKLVERFWATVTVVVNWLTLSPFDAQDGRQYPIDLAHQVHNTHTTSALNIDPALQYRPSPNGGGPEFKPPTGRPDDLPGGDFKCDYSAMGSDWIPCSTEEDRGCWLKNTKTGEQYNIKTDYEKKTPRGRIVDYTLVLSNKTINTDGIPFPYGKLFSFNFPQGQEFDGKFPGPLIQACWGDTLNVTVYNRLPETGDNANGTSIHWHGLRMLDAMQFDGVNGVTQCPIAPGDHFTYTFPVMQYGTTWYHSHYSMQYADGTQGPLILHGPTSAPFDHPLYPSIITDWGHNSAFAAAYPNVGLKEPSILLNGKGNVNRFNGEQKNTEPIPAIHQVTFEPGKRYLMRLINTSFKTAFRFSIDDHKFQVVANDLVPIQTLGIFRETIVVHIGQRYNIIVQAKDKASIGDGNFWIRTHTCFADGVTAPEAGKADYMKTGIVRYNPDSKDDPTTSGWGNEKCDDIPLGDIKPMHEWKIGAATNNITGGQKVQLGFGNDPNYIHSEYLWEVKDALNRPPKNFMINYTDPIFLRLGDPKSWRPEEVVIYADDEFNDKTWAYIVIDQAGGHPIHLHGHDFAVVYSSDKTYDPKDIQQTCPGNPKFTCDNPPRRDVIMPNDGTYTVIAFKTDNPGSWLMHCHIASHAGAGLALQILERPKDAAAMWPPGSQSFTEVQRVCGNWDAWWNKIKIVQDDSGI